MKLPVVLVGLCWAAAVAGAPNDDDDDDARIVGGSDAPAGSAPYIAAIYSNTFTFMCSGSIISDRWVLSVASCIRRSTDLHITVGSEVLGNQEAIYSIEKIIPHYKYDTVTIENNIGLLKTNVPIVFTDKVKPIALPWALMPNVSITVVGWGRTNKDNPAISNNLQRLTTFAITNKQCQERYAPLKIFDYSNICMFTAIGQGACFGDGGGPYVYNGQVVALVSWGVPCAAGVPDVATQVIHYMDWIKNCQAWY